MTRAEKRRERAAALLSYRGLYYPEKQFDDWDKFDFPIFVEEHDRQTGTDEYITAHSDLETACEYLASEAVGIDRAMVAYSYHDLDDDRKNVGPGKIDGWRIGYLFLTDVTVTAKTRDGKRGPKASATYDPSTAEYLKRSDTRWAPSAATPTEGE